MKKTISIVPNEVTTAKLHGYLLGAVGPRPIAFASTVDKDGNPNLSPFSFFNVFSANPPILIFSPARRVRNNTTKHTLENVLETKEVVVNIVNYAIVQQMSLSSTEYAEGVNEFKKAGLTMLKSDVVTPFRVAESPVQFECKVTKVEALGDEGGAGNLVFCEVVKVHVDSSVLDENGSIDQHKIDLVARMGGNWYSRAKEGMFEVPKPLSTLGIGIDSLPDKIKNSKLLSGNDLGLLGNIEVLPTAKSVQQFVNENEDAQATLATNDSVQLQLKAKEYIFNNNPLGALKLLLAGIDIIE
ncbi:flavin reductase domain-containing FMN-binding protein [Cellulophaga geojensis KL-A]|uniref:Flavin reductase domain-containing FMN-binding protein n=1 Tax=Cellulophaga geojensis KL-A TaxID=1328323 RepID=A0ABN0RML2_9FLAO|nr:MULTISPECIES: flavin reductase family protein [Cellulophaga]EWH13121.1 flavin reductase domain-containing FMN-binding protein [Cellulophaga geojensis KL-A]TVZ08604.1 flavin reductase (DIM6/NTAB) family NADH-FMN oxidoreductase RutF [Cellulophaga sp. RHA_52]